MRDEGEAPVNARVSEVIQMSKYSSPHARRAGSPNGRRRSRWLTRIALLLVAAAALALNTGVQAVHDDGFFELDADADSGAALGDDWDVVYDGGHQATAAVFVPDGEGPTIFTGGGSKDDLDTTGWQHKSGSTPPKDELLDAFAARYGGNIYFGADRTSNSGTAALGFWFFQEEVVPITTGPNAGKFGPGKHKDGDILVLSDFSQGGGTITIRVYQWNAPGGDIPGTGAINGTLDLIAGTTETPANCNVVPLGDPYCATVNTVATPSPWPFTPKVGSPGSFAPGEFFEGGIDLSFLGLEDECFASFLAETRTSNSVDSTLKDFVGGSFQPCDSGITTTPKDGAGNTIGTLTTNDLDINAGASLTVKDSAVLTVDGVQNWSGTLNFFLCGPADLAPTAGKPATCESGGTGPIAPAAGNPVTNVTAANPILSANTIVSSAGKYCWRAEFTSTTEGVPPATDSAETECFVVNPVTPGVATSAQGQNGGSVSLGTPLFDNAIVSPVANKPGSPVINPTTGGGFAGGTVTFNLHGPFASATIGSTACTLANRIGFITVALSGSSGDSSGTATSGTNPLLGLAGSGTFTPTQAGYYAWVASYATAIAPESLNPNTTNGGPNGCGDSNEVIRVLPNSPTIATTASGAGGAAPGTLLSDSATISGATATFTGTITFKLYGPSADPTPGVCTTEIGSSTVTITAPTTTYGSGAASTGTFSPTAPGYYFWIASYSGDGNNNPVSGACGDANERSFIVSLGLTTSQWFLPNDSATITASGGGPLAGSVRFRVWVNDANCTEGAHLYDSGAINVTTGTGTDLSKTVETSNLDPTKRVTVNGATGTPAVYWRVQYTSTNPAHPHAESTCGKERTTLTINNNFTP